jgi:hypothetical protein
MRKARDKWDDSKAAALHRRRTTLARRSPVPSHARTLRAQRYLDWINYNDYDQRHERRCKRCGLLHNIDEFYSHPETATGRVWTCRRCLDDIARGIPPRVHGVHVKPACKLIGNYERAAYLGAIDAFSKPFKPLKANDLGSSEKIIEIKG